MSKTTKSILKEIDSLIAKGGASKKVMNLLDGIADDLEKKKMVKNKKERTDLINKVFDKMSDIESALKSDKLDTKEILAKTTEAIRSMDAPQVTVKPPEVKVNVPQAKAPVVNVPPNPPFPKEINVKKPSWFSLKSIIDQLRAIKKTITDIRFPSDPIAVKLTHDGKTYRAMGGSSGVASIPTFKNSDGEVKQGLVDGDYHLQADVLSSELPTGAATAAKQLADDHKVTVSNPTADPETGLATSANQDTANTLLGGIAGFVPTAYDYIALTYVAAGDGAGEVETAIFKTGGSGGTTIATLTLTYNASDEIATVTKS